MCLDHVQGGIGSRKDASGTERPAYRCTDPKCSVNFAQAKYKRAKFKNRVTRVAASIIISILLLICIIVAYSKADGQH